MISLNLSGAWVSASIILTAVQSEAKMATSAFQAHMTRFIDQIKDIYLKVKTQYGLDLRALAVFRIGLAIVLLANLLTLFPHLQEFFTDEGVLSRSALTYELGWSLCNLSGSWEIQVVLFSLAAVFALALLVGYRTRLFTILSWIMIVSLHNRNPWIFSGGENLLQQLLLWSIFLPLGALYSVDSALVPDKDWNRSKPTMFFSPASFGLLLQVFFVYFMAGIAKSGSEWTQEGTALYYILNLSSFQTALTPWLLSLPQNLLTFLSFFTLYLELYGTWLLLIPIFIQPLRIFIVLLFILFHLGIATFLFLDLFAWIDIVSLFALMPSLFWDRIGRLLQGHHKLTLLHIYYDGDCGFCKKILRLLLTFALLEQIPMLPAQSDMRMQEQMNRYNSWVLIDCEKKPHYGAEALAHLLQASPILFLLGKLLAKPTTLPIAQQLYVYVAKYRNKLSRLTNLLHWRTNPLKLPSDTSWFLGFLVCLLILINLSHLLPNFTFSRVLPLQQFVSILNMEETWTMFAPSPPKANYRLSVTGKLNNRHDVIMFQDSCISGRSTTPSPLIQDHCDAYWQKYMSNLRKYYVQPAKKSINIRRSFFYLSNFLCHRWNTDPRHQEQQVLQLNIYRYGIPIPLPGKGKKPFPPKIMWQQECPVGISEEKK
jgi:predicted DCC family thiol-disulfide oxidoreductase YuxK